MPLRVSSPTVSCLTLLMLSYCFCLQGSVYEGAGRKLRGTEAMRMRNAVRMQFCHSCPCRRRCCCCFGMHAQHTEHFECTYLKSLCCVGASTSKHRSQPQCIDVVQVLRQTGFLEPQNCDNMFADHTAGDAPAQPQLATSVG